jgi:hypothetical protein
MTQPPSKNKKQANKTNEPTQPTAKDETTKAINQP